MEMSSVPQRIHSSHRIETLYLEREVMEYPWVQKFLGRFAPSRIVPISDVKEIVESCPGRPYPLDEQAFHTMLIGKQKGPFVRRCPCSPHTVRCGYHFVSVGLGCPIDCSYCFLQGFLNTSFPVLYVNFQDLERELDELERKAAEKKECIRMGTGEMTDSLVFEPITFFAQDLLQRFSRWSHLILELKTKSTFVDTLLDSAIPNVVLAWSLTPDEIAAVEEPHAPSNTQRLLAAFRAHKSGYRVGFHFDPIMACPDWETMYFRTLCQLFELIPASQIAWISLGAFRIFPALRDTIRSRHPQSQLLLREMVVGYDGKLRYFRKDRVSIFRKMRDWIEELGRGEVQVYLCMESAEVWKDVFGEKRVLPLILEK